MTQKKLNTYTSEFKESAIKLALDSDQPIPKIAKNLGVNPNTLYTWVHNASKPKENKTVAKKESRIDEIKHLKKQMVRLTQERDILKKAAGYFAQEIV
jgi:transposase